MSSEVSTLKISPLTTTNYRIWADDMKDWLQMQGLWQLVTGVEKKPKSDEEKIEKRENKAEKAAGAICSAVSAALKVHIRDCEDDPVKIWSTLKDAFIQQRTAPRFNAYQSLLSIQKEENEPLDALINRVDQQIRVIKSLSPDSFTLDNLYDELATMAIIRSLPHQFDDVIRTISILDVFDKQKVINGLRNMDNSRNLAPSGSTVLSTTSNPQYSSNNRQKPRSKCSFCNKLGHLEEKCWTKERIQKVVQEQNKAQNASTSPVPGAPQTASITAASSFYSSPIQSQTYTSWNADTGASSHMTPHHHWL